MSLNPLFCEFVLYNNILTLSVWTGNDQARVSSDGYSESTSTADLQQGQYQQWLIIICYSYNYFN